MDRSARIGIFEMIADQTKGNFEKIRTWQSTYNFKVRQSLSSHYVANTFNVKTDDGVIQEFDSTFRIAIDMASGSIFRSKVTQRMESTGKRLKQVVKFPNTKPNDGRNIVTAEHYVHFEPDAVWPEFMVLQGHPKAMNKRAAFREPVALTRKQHFAELIDPRQWYGEDDRLTTWRTLNFYVHLLKGEYGGSESARIADERLTLFQAAEPDGTWYKLRALMPSPRDPVRYVNTIYSPAAGFNPISTVMSHGVDGEKPKQDADWDWKQVDGIYLPARFTQTFYDRENGAVVFRREATMTEATLNQPLAPDQFDYTGLGLKDGDLIMDKIENVALIMKNGMPEKLADFGSKYVPPAVSGPSSSVKKWLIGTNAVCVAVLLFLWFNQRRKRLPSLPNRGDAAT